MTKHEVYVFAKEQEDPKPRPKKKKTKTDLLEESLTDLEHKKSSVRESALSSVADILTNTLQHNFLKNKYLTLLYHCLNSIKKGSKKEICLASRVIGLLSITVGYTDGLANEILKESIPKLSQALDSCRDPTAKASLLECVAIITFVGSLDHEESEESLKIIWKFVNLRLPDCCVVDKEPSMEVLKAAVSSWSFLLGMLICFNIDAKFWKGSVCGFTNELENSDPSVRIVVGEALALIFELGDIVKFFCESERYGSIDELKAILTNRVKNLSNEAGDRGSMDKILIKRHHSLFHDLSRFLAGRHGPETLVKIGRKSLNVSTWSQMIQVNYLKNFLGGGFVKHAQENDMFHDFLDLMSKEDQTEHEQDISSGEEDTVQYIFEPDIRDDNQSVQSITQKLFTKAKTQRMNKQRKMSQAKNMGRYAVNLTNED